MTHDVETRLTEALRWHAADDVDADRLLGAALTRGRTRQRRRRIAGGLCGAGAGAVTAVALAAVPLFGPGSGGLGGVVDLAVSPANTPSDGRLPPLHLPPGGRHVVPKLDTDAPGVAQRPDLVGTDPQAVHFGLDRMPAPVSRVSWSVDGGIENVDLRLDGPNNLPLVLFVQVGRQLAPLVDANPDLTVKNSPVGDIDGRPLTLEEANLDGLTERSVRWSPVDGVQARVAAPDLAVVDLIRFARMVRFDQAARCAAPARLTAVPAGWKLAGCTVTLSQGPIESLARISLAAPADARVDVTLGDPVAPEILEGKAIRLSSGTKAVDGSAPGEPRIVIYNLGGMSVTVTGTRGVKRNTAVEIADGVHIAGEADRPDGWPASPVG